MSGMTTGDRTPNVAALAAQLDSTMGILYERLAGLTDEEYLWEPAPSCWSLRPRGQHRTAKAYGKGDWVWEYEAPTPQPPPLRTIAWLCWHMAAAGMGLAVYTTGDHRDLTLSLQTLFRSGMPADRRRWHGAPARGRRPLARGLRRGRPRGVRTGGAQQLPVGPGPEAAAGRHPLVAEPGDDPPRRRDRDAPRPVRPAPVSERAGAAEPVSTVLAAGGTATTVWAVETSGDDRTDHGLGEQGGLGPGDAWVERTLHEDGVPDAEHEHRPDLSGVVGVLAAVLVEQLLGVLQIQQLAGAGAGQDVPGPVVHLPAQPDPDRRGEAELLAVDHRGGHDRIQGAAQRELRVAGVRRQLELHRHRGGDLEDLLVQVGHPQLQRVGQRHPLAVDGVPAEELVGPLAGEHHRDVLGRLLRHEVQRHQRGIGDRVVQMPDDAR